MADEAAKQQVESETIVEVDAADGRGFQPVDDVEQELGELQLQDGLDNLPRCVHLRVDALRSLQEKHAELEEQFEKERRLLELKYEKLYAPIYQERSAIVSGAKEVEEVTNPTQGDERPHADKKDEEFVKGIPGFWVRALMNNPTTEELVQERDLEALQFLVDIRSIMHEENNGFRLEFEFAENPFFENKVLAKDYDVADATEDGDAVLRNITGTEIQWKSGQNLCETTKKVKQRAKGSKDTRVVAKQVPCESFFQFFANVEMPSEEEETEETRELMNQLTIDFQIGFTIHESIVPQAVLWFTGEAVVEDSEYDPDEDYDDEEDSDEEEGASRRKKFPGLKAGADSTEKPPECKNQ